MRQRERGREEQGVHQRDRAQPEPVDEGTLVDRPRADRTDRRHLSERAGHRGPVCHRAPPIEGATRAHVRRTAERADRRVSATTPATTSAGSQSWPSGTTPSCRATPNGTIVASEASSPSDHADPRDDAGLGEHGALDLLRRRAEQPEPVQLGPPVRDDGREGVDHDDRREQHDHADDDVVEQVDGLGVLVGSGGPGPVVGADRHQHAGGGRGQHDHRRQHAAEQVRPAAGVVRRQVAGDARTERRPGEDREVLQQPRGAALARPSATRIAQEPEVCIAAYGSWSCAVTVMVTTPMARA